MQADLAPRTVYLSPRAIKDAEARAGDLCVSVGLLLRLILIGKQPPLKS